MEDLSLRAAFHRALDPAARPAPWLVDTVMNDLRARRSQLRASAVRRRSLSLMPPDELLRLAAVALILVLIVVGMAAFFGLNLFIHRTVPVQFPHAVSRACSSSTYVITADGTQWQSDGGGGAERSIDGGVTWRDVSPPHVAGSQSVAAGLCVVDATHAWTTEDVLSCPSCSGSQAQDVVVLSTSDGGASWRNDATVPVGGTAVSAVLDFADDHHGWLLTDTGLSTLPQSQRTFYATSDGGVHWTRLASGNLEDRSELGLSRSQCEASGLVMPTATDGFVTWECDLRGPSDGTVSPAIVTHDGGRSWSAVDLPAVSPGTAGTLCGLQPPVFSAENGAMPFVCGATIAPVYGVFRTGDGGRTWTIGRLPASTSATVDFADGLDGFALVPPAPSASAAGSKLYATTDGGKTWRLAASGLFPGTQVIRYEFTDGRLGYASVGGYRVAVHVWRTQDGGKTWSVAAPYHSVGWTVCALPAAATAANAALSAPRMYGAGAGWDAGARHTSDGGAHWNTSLPSFPSLATAGYGESFLDANDAWVVEAVGSPTACADHVFVYRTTDGGQSWARIASLTVPPKAPATQWTPSVYFLDRSHGWVFATTGALYRTADGGSTWTEVSLTAGVNNTGCTAGPGVSFSSPTAGWLALHCFDNSSENNNPAPYRLLATADGGVTWTVRTIASKLLTYDSMPPAFFDARHGQIWDPAFGMLAVTSDGGRTWSVRTPPLVGYPCIGKGGTTGFCSNDAIMGLTFVGPSDGWALIGTISLPQGKGGPIDVAYRFVRTTDGGATWSVFARRPTTSAPDTQSTSLQFIDATDAYWLDGTKFLASHDGGRTWRVVFTGVAPQ